MTGLYSLAPGAVVSASLLREDFQREPRDLLISMRNENTDSPALWQKKKENMSSRVPSWRTKCHFLTSKNSRSPPGSPLKPLKKSNTLREL